MDDGVFSGNSSVSTVVDDLASDEVFSPVFSPVSRSQTPLGFLRTITPVGGEVPLINFPASACAAVGVYKGGLKIYPEAFNGLDDARQRDFLSCLNAAYTHAVTRRDRATPDFFAPTKKINGVQALRNHLFAAQESKVTFLDLAYFREGSRGWFGPFCRGELSNTESSSLCQRSLADQFYVAAFNAGTPARTTEFAKKTGLVKSIRKIIIQDPSRQKYTPEVRDNIFTRTVMNSPSIFNDDVAGAENECICKHDFEAERNRRITCPKHGSYPLPDDVIADNILNKNINDRMCMPGCFRIPLIDKHGKHGYIIVASITELKKHDTRLISIICGPPEYDGQDKISDGGLISYTDDESSMDSFPVIVRKALLKVKGNPKHAGNRFHAKSRFAPHVCRTLIHNGRDGDIFEDVAGAILSATTPADVRDAFRVSILSMSAHLRTYSPESDTDIARFFSTYFILSSLSGVHKGSCYLNSSWDDEEQARMALQLLGRGSSAWEALTSRLAMTTRIAQEQTIMACAAHGTVKVYDSVLSIDSRDTNYPALVSAAADKITTGAFKALGHTHDDGARINQTAMGAWREDQSSKATTKRMLDDGHGNDVEATKRRRKEDNIKTRTTV